MTSGRGVWRSATAMGRVVGLGMAAGAVAVGSVAAATEAAASTSTSASTSASTSVSPTSTAGAVGTPAPRASHVVLSSTASAVQPNATLEITATVLPRVAGRSVTLKKAVGTRLVGVARALTNAQGVATFHVRFGRTGSTPLRAFVAATSRYGAAFSPRMIEDVATVLPLTLPEGKTLALGTVSYDVGRLQQRLLALGYWVDTTSGGFDDSTQQAVYALQKAAGLQPTGVVDAKTAAALNAGVLPHPRTTSGTAIDVDLEHDLVMFVQNGKLVDVLNTSSGGGYTYTEDGETDVATTPTGVFSIGRTVDGLVTDSLGSLWRPRFFYEGFAIHGDSYVPPTPVSHGCVRVSNEAIDWIWANNMAPVGTEVWVY